MTRPDGFRERKQPDGSLKRSWVFTHPDHPTNKGKQHEASNRDNQRVGIQPGIDRPDNFGGNLNGLLARGDDESSKRNNGAGGTLRFPVADFGTGNNGRSVLDAGTTPASSGSNQPGRQTDSQYLSDGNLALAPDVENEPDGQPAKVIPLRIVPKPIEAEPEKYESPADFDVPFEDTFDKSIWKRPRRNVNLPGLLIRRIPGYDINGECVYGMNYLKQLPGGTTSADKAKYPHAGFFTWRALAESGRLVRETEE